MSCFHFKEWLLVESADYHILLPYINHKKDQRMARNGDKAIENDHLKTDYGQAIENLYKIVKESNSLTVALRKATRCYEITKDKMHLISRHDEDYLHSYQKTEPDNDIWLIVRALDDFSNNKMPNLKELL